jgi:tripartite-type tricarboxylate transporter receptor subunit TctC
MHQRQRLTAAIARISVVLFAGLFFLTPAHAQSAVEEFYRARQLNLVVGYGPGGGYDITARLLARYIGRHIPGNPTVVVQNMPGAGSLRALNWLHSVAPKDGATFALFGSDMPLIAVLGANASVQFDPKKLTWLGSSSSFAGDAFILIVRPGAATTSIVEARRPDGAPLVLAGTGEGARDSDVPKILRDALALNIKQVLGYPDTPSIFLAIERGEVDGRTSDFSAVKSIKPDWLKAGSGYRVLLQFARITRHRELPDVPTARELAADADARALIELAEAPLLTMARPFAAPPGVPGDRAHALAAAFEATHRDPQFLAEAQRLGLEISPVNATDLAISVDKLGNAPANVLAYMRKLFAGHKGG